MAEVEEVVFNGITFRRYPNSRRKTHRHYFRPKTADAARGIQALHQEIWKAAYGPIPKGHHIHHIDGNPLNNELSNLACVTVAEHRRIHRSSHCIPEQKEHLARIRGKASAWHQSAEGRAWHKEHAARIYEQKEYETVDSVCVFCGKTFQSSAWGIHAKFCSALCRERERQASGRRKREKVCVICETTFRTARKATQTCSRQCSGALRRKRNQM